MRDLPVDSSQCFAFLPEKLSVKGNLLIISNQNSGQEVVSKRASVRQKCLLRTEISTVVFFLEKQPRKACLLLLCFRWIFYFFLLHPQEERTSFSFQCSQLPPFLRNLASSKTVHPPVQGSPQICLCCPSPLQLYVLSPSYPREICDWRCWEETPTYCGYHRKLFNHL